MKNIILNHVEITNKTKRIAYQILETLVEENEIIIAGISKSGFQFAENIVTILNEISDLKIVLCEIKINKQQPNEPFEINLESKIFQDKAVVLVDDVLNSGATLIFAVKQLLDFNIGKLKTAVLVDRNHKKFPVKADFKGISLSTSLQNHVTVEFETNNFHAFLS